PDPTVKRHRCRMQRLRHGWADRECKNPAQAVAWAGFRVRPRGFEPLTFGSGGVDVTPARALGIPLKPYYASLLETRYQSGIPAAIPSSHRAFVTTFVTALRPLGLALSTPGSFRRGSAPS